MVGETLGIEDFLVSEWRAAIHDERSPADFSNPGLALADSGHRLLFVGGGKLPEGCHTWSHDNKHFSFD